MEKIALLPGGFKPPHAGHYNMAKWLANNTDADTVIVKVGAKERDGITRDMSLKLWDLYRSTDSDPAANKLSIIPSKHNSPVKDVYDFIEQDAPENSTIYLGMGEKEIKTNDQRFANIGKFADPKGINFETKLVPPQAGGVSGTDMRGFIMDKDQYSFFDYIPDHLTPEQKEQAWQIVMTEETSEWAPGDPVSFEMWTSDWSLKSFGKEYESNFKNREDAVAHYRSDKAEDWAFKSYAYVAKKIPGFGGDLEEDFYDPRNKSVDFMRSSEWKAGMPDGPKDDIPRSGDRIHNRQTLPVSWEESKKLHENNTTSTVLINNIPINLETMNTPSLQMKGMMGRGSLEGGMVFPYEISQRRDFHMKKCKIPLDIVFVSGGVIKIIHHNCPPCKENNCPNYSGMADNVLEFPGGYCKQNNINNGDKVNLNINPTLPKLIDKYNDQQNQSINENLNELSDREIKFFATHSDILKQLNTPNFKLKFLELHEELEGERLEALEYFWEEFFSKLEDSCEIEGAFDKKVNEKMSTADLDTIDAYADKQLDPVDVVLTDKHFFNRLNDPRNEKPISSAELIGFFKRLARKKDEFVEFLTKYKELVVTDNRTNINIPFMKLANKVIAKTVIRKKEFNTSNPKLSLETKYGAHDLISQYKNQIQTKYGHQQYRNLQTLMSQSKDEEVNNWLKIKGYMNEHTITFTKDDMAKLHKDGKLVKADEDGKEHNYVFDELDEEYCPMCVTKFKLEEKKGKCTPTKGKRFAKRVNGKCVSYGQKGKAKKGGDRIRPGTAKGNAYCARSAKIKKCKNPPCANTLSRKKWKCQGSRSVAETKTFSKDWWLNMIYENILTEGGAAGHMAHPFNLSSVNSGKDLKDIFNKAANSLQLNPGSVKIDGVNSSIRLVDLEGKKQFVMDRGSKKPLDIKGITKADLEDRFKPGHGMVKVGGQVLDMFNEALPSLTNDLKKLGAWDDPNILFNMEYVSGKTNVQDYGSNFIAIHGLNKVESKEVQGKRGPLIKRASSEMSYDKAALQSMLDNLTPIAKKNGFEVYGSVPTEMKKKPNFASALSKLYTVKSNEGDKTQSLDAWLSELNNIPEEDFIFMNVNDIKKKVGAVSKQVYVTLLNGDNIDELYESEEDKQKAIEGFVTYLATEKLGDEILKVLDSPMGTVDNHEGVVIRDKNISTEPFKITGKFILGGMFSDF